MNVAKAIERRHGEDPGVSAGFARCLAGIHEARKGIKRVESLSKAAGGGEREIDLVRTKLDEAEMWLSRAVHAVKSGCWPEDERGG